MWKCFAEVVKRDDDDGLERNVVEGIESARKENEAEKDRTIQTFKVEDEKLNEERRQRTWRNSRRL